MFSVSIIGCGFVGLCLASVCANKGAKVFAVDIDEVKIKKLKVGQPIFYEKDLEELIKNNLNRNLIPTTNLENSIKNSDITFLTVGTPSNSDGSINLDFIKESAKNIGESLKDKSSYQTIVVKSTVVPRTTNTIIKPILEEYSHKKFGKDFGLLVNPEFLREGSAVHDTEHPHLIVLGSDDKRSVTVLESFYKEIYKESTPEILKTSPESAELIKYSNNAFLATKISFINSIANICQKIPNTDVNTIAYAIGKDPRIGPLFLQAGPGYGGSCFPKDVKALLNFCNKIGYSSPLIAATKQVNDSQVLLVLDLIKKELSLLSNKKIAVLGLAFKRDTDDIRESVSIRLIEELLKQNVRVAATDPMAIKNTQKFLQNKIQYYEDIELCVKDSDCAVIMTDWNYYKELTEKSFESMKQKLIIDARRIIDSQKFPNCRLVILGKNF